MAKHQYVYHMDGVAKTYPGGKKCIEGISLGEVRPTGLSHAGCSPNVWKVRILLKKSK